MLARYCAVSSTLLCSVDNVTMRRRVCPGAVSRPFNAQLLLSVAPLVKAMLSTGALISRATCSRARSTAALAL